MKVSSTIRLTAFEPTLGYRWSAGDHVVIEATITAVGDRLQAWIRACVLTKFGTSEPGSISIELVGP